MKELIRHIIKEETKLPALIRRRVSEDELERGFKDSLKDALEMIKRGKDNSLSLQFLTYQQMLEHFIWLTISMLIDSIHYELFSTIPEDIQWYDEVYNMLEKHYRSRIVDVYMKHFPIRL
jgi:hypothetical protein